MLSQMTSMDPGSPKHRKSSKYEIGIVLLILLLSLAHFAANLSTLSYIGQDYQQHTTVLEKTQANGISFAESSPPALYLVGVAVSKFAPAEWKMEAISSFIFGLNILVLLGWYQMLRVLIPAMLVRLSAFILIVFLPVRTIHSTVFASDALTVIPLLCATIMIVAHVRAQKWWTQLIAAFGVSGACCLGLFTKFTFVLLPAGCAVIYALWLLRPAPRRWKRSLFITALVGAILPASLFGLWMWEQMKASNNLWINNVQEGKGMEWSAVFGLKWQDVELLEGPGFECGQPMKASEGHSYLPLLHLGTFSDIWNFFQVPSAEMMQQRTAIRISFGRERTYLAEALTPWSLKLSIPITLIALFGSLYQMLRAVRASLKAPTLRTDFICALGILSACYAAPSIGGLPYYWAVYIYGFWTPRLVFPSVMAAISLGFSALSDVLPRPLSFTLLFYSTALAALYLLIM
jgi:hypothetical protein